MSTPQQDVRDRLHYEGAFDSSNSNKSADVSYIVVFFIWFIASLPAKTMISNVFNPSPLTSYVLGFILTYAAFKVSLHLIRNR
jgi:hypothetical protein